MFATHFYPTARSSSCHILGIHIARMLWDTWAEGPVAIANQMTRCFVPLYKRGGLDWDASITAVAICCFVTIFAVRALINALTILGFGLPAGARLRRCDSFLALV
jgi:hypothetical protein